MLPILGQAGKGTLIHSHQYLTLLQIKKYENGKSNPGWWMFLGVEELIRNVPGVSSTVVGYTGGDVPNATYRNHGTHAEAIEIMFDPSTVSYRSLLEFFFQIHDPATLNRQGNDRGLSYRSAVFYLNEEQRKIAETLIKEMTASGKWPGEIVTAVVPATGFWNAEEEHQNYLQKPPYGYTCHFIRPDWILG